MPRTTPTEPTRTGPHGADRTRRPETYIPQPPEIVAAQRSLLYVAHRDELSGAPDAYAQRPNTQNALNNLRHAVQEGAIPQRDARAMQRALEHSTRYIGFWNSVHEKIDAEHDRTSRRLPPSLVAEAEPGRRSHRAKQLGRAEFFATHAQGALYFFYLSNAAFRRGVQRNSRDPEALARFIDQEFSRAIGRTRNRDDAGAFRNREDVPMITRDTAEPHNIARTVARMDLLDYTGLLIAKSFNCTDPTALSRNFNNVRQSAHASASDGSFDPLWGIKQAEQVGTLPKQRKVTKWHGLAVGPSKVKLDSMKQHQRKIDFAGDRRILRALYNVEKGVAFAWWTYAEWCGLGIIAISNFKTANSIAKLVKKLDRLDPHSEDRLLTDKLVQAAKRQLDLVHNGRRERFRAYEGLLTDRSNGFAILGTQYATRFAARRLLAGLNAAYPTPTFFRRQTEAQRQQVRDRFLLDTERRAHALADRLGHIDRDAQLLETVTDAVDSLLSDRGGAVTIRDRGIAARLRPLRRPAVWIRDHLPTNWLRTRVNAILNDIGDNVPNVEDVLSDSSRFAEIGEAIGGVVAAYARLLRRRNAGIIGANEGLALERLGKLAAEFEALNDLEVAQERIASRANAYWYGTPAPATPVPPAPTPMATETEPGTPTPAATDRPVPAATLAPLPPEAAEYVRNLATGIRTRNPLNRAEAIRFIEETNAIPRELRAYVLDELHLPESVAGRVAGESTGEQALDYAALYREEFARAGLTREEAAARLDRAGLRGTLPQQVLDALYPAPESHGVESPARTTIVQRLRAAIEQYGPSWEEAWAWVKGLAGVDDSERRQLLREAGLVAPSAT